MPTTMRCDASFVVRIWWERRIGVPPIWRGQAVHARTGQVHYFDQLEDLLAFIGRWTGVPPRPHEEPPLPGEHRAG